MSKSEVQAAPKPFSARAAYSDLYPLEEFYAAQGLMLPVIDRVHGSDVPAPYHSLLVHQRDMTSTLERFHKDRIHIRVMSQYTCENEYFREVILELDGTRKPVEFGAIKINLELFPLQAREEILRARKPLGGILAECGIAVKSRPRAYLRVASDEYIGKELKLDDICLLYGRGSSLIDSWERPLAEIVEILPP